MMPRGRNWRSAPVYEKPQPARLILARALGISIDEAGDALTALIQGGYGIGPRNPTNGMLAAYMEALTPPTTHESVITAIGKARVRWQAMLAQGTEMSMSRKRCPASCDTHPQGGNSTQIEVPAPLSGAVTSASSADAQTLSPNPKEAGVGNCSGK